MARKRKIVDSFYKSPAWLKVRAAVLRRDNYCCVNCGASVRGKGQARVDHRMPRKKFPELALHLPNLRTFASRVTTHVTLGIVQVRMDQRRTLSDRTGSPSGRIGLSAVSHIGGVRCPT